MANMLLKYQVQPDSQMLSIDENSNYVFSFLLRKKGEGVAIMGADIQGVDF